MKVRYHPLFERWLTELADLDEEVFGELRVLYAYCFDSNGEDVAVVLLGGDKTRLGNLWYPPNISEAQNRLDQFCRHHTDQSPIVKRGDR